MKTIESILDEINEDKKDNLRTTSFKFKKDIWNFFQNSKNQIAVEFGTHIGQTTRVLSFLFEKVYTINKNDNIKAKALNSDRNNIVYLNFDLYSPKQLPIDEQIDVLFIDAMHTYEAVISDINRAFTMNCSPETNIVFDDYGLLPPVKKAVNEAINKIT